MTVTWLFAFYLRMLRKSVVTLSHGGCVPGEPGPASTAEGEALLLNAGPEILQEAQNMT